MEKPILEVLEFQKTFGAPLPNAPTMPTQERFALRQKLLQEEVDELDAAFKLNDLTEMADAVGDIMYIILGTAHEMGIADRLPEIFSEIHRSNMSKTDEDGKPIFREDGKVMKSERYTKPNLTLIMERDYSAYKPLAAAAEEVSNKMWEDFGNKVDLAIHKKLDPKDKKEFKSYMNLQEKFNEIIKVNFDTDNIMHRAKVTLYGNITFEVLE